MSSSYPVERSHSFVVIFCKVNFALMPKERASLLDDRTLVRRCLVAPRWSAHAIEEAFADEISSVEVVEGLKGNPTVI